jgi:superfamily I DNA/RNA helicase
MNNEQRQAVEASVDSHVFVTAPPGSGKTRVVTDRLLFLLRQGVPAREILFLTFSRSACKEIINRIAENGCEGGEGASVSVLTFHALSLQLLKLKGGWKLIGEADRKSLLGVIISTSSAKMSPTRLGRYIEGNRTGNVDPQAHSMKMMYLEWLQILKAVDMSSLVPKATKELQANRVRHGFTHIIVDEAQDLSTQDLELLAAMQKQRDSRFFVVQDPNQTIFSFRLGGGSKEATNAQDKLRGMFPTALGITLTVSYRSFSPILRAAGQVLASQSVECPPMSANRGDGPPVVLRGFADFVGQCDAAAEAVRSSPHGSTVAILVRRRDDVDSVVKHLKLRHAIDAVSNQPNALEEDLDTALLWLRLLFNDKDVPAFIRLWIGKGGSSRTAYNVFSKGDMSQGNFAMISGIRSTACPIAHSIAEDLLSSSEILDEMEGYPLPKQIRETLPLLRIDHATVETIANLAAEKGWEKGYELIEYLTVCDCKGRDGTGTSVQVMTTHSSKGMEFDTVLCMGLDTDAYPMGGKSCSDKLPELFLLYVAITRARDRLFLFFTEGAQSFFLSGVQSTSCA